MGSRPLTIQEVADLDRRINRSDILREFKYARRYLEKIVLLVDHSEREEATSIREKATGVWLSCCAAEFAGWGRPGGDALAQWGQRQGDGLVIAVA